MKNFSFRRKELSKSSIPKMKSPPYSLSLVLKIQWTSFLNLSFLSLRLWKSMIPQIPRLPSCDQSLPTRSCMQYLTLVFRLQSKLVMSKNWFAFPCFSTWIVTKIFSWLYWTIRRFLKLIKFLILLINLIVLKKQKNASCAQSVSERSYLHIHAKQESLAPKLKSEAKTNKILSLWFPSRSK